MKIRLCSIFIICILLLTAVPGLAREYIVNRGDSLYLIARRFGTTIDSLKRINNLSSDMIYVGQRLTIFEEGGEGRQYTVAPGDSLYLIGRRYGVSVADLISWNNLDSYLIYPGQILRVAGNLRTRISGRVEISNKTRGIKPVDEVRELPTTIPLNNPEQPADTGETELIIKYKNQLAPQQLPVDDRLQPLNQMSLARGRVVRYRLEEEGQFEQVLKEYQERGDIAWIEPNYICYPTAMPADPYYNSHQWPALKLNLEAAWDLEQGDRQVVVAVVDTGIIRNHPDLVDNLLPGADFVGGDNSYPIDSYTLTDDDPTDETPREQGGSHGTHVAGIIGAVANNHQGIAGVNWRVSILPIRALKKTGGTIWDVAEGIYYAIDQGADVINLSLGSNHQSRFQREAIQEAVRQGITVIAATGNEGSSVYYPAALEETIAVGAVGNDEELAYYSNYGPEVDLVAPGGSYGESIYSTWGYYEGGQAHADYAGMIGTSMATPHVSGVAALLIASGVEGSDTIKKILTETAKDLGPEGRDEKYGYGLVDAYGALMGKKLSNPRVFTALKQGSNLILQSEVAGVDSRGFFNLNAVRPGDVFLAGWRDVNQNGIVDQGDYYGESQRLSLKEGAEYTGLELTINYLSGDNNLKYYPVQTGNRG